VSLAHIQSSSEENPYFESDHFNGGGSALRETTLALQNLNEAFSEHYQGSVLDWGAEAHSKVQTRAGGVFKTLFDEK
jgi:hypothetical protein